MPGLYSYFWHINSFESHLGKKETHMSYLASVITVSVFLELLWKSSLLVCSKLNIFRCPQVNQFDLVDCYLSVPPYSYHYIQLYICIMETWPFEVHQCHSHLWDCFYCVIDYFRIMFNYPLEIFIIAFSATCVSIIALVAETILFSDS